MDALLLAVLNALWQGAALIALVTLALRAGLRRNATTACVVWSVAFVVVALLPAIDLAVAHAWAPATVRAPTEPPLPVAAESQQAIVPVRVVNVPYSAPNAPDALVVAPSPATRWHEVTLALGGAATAFARAWGILVLGAWAAVAGTLVLRLGLGYAAIARMKRGATPLADAAVAARLRAAGHRRHADVACSPQVAIPCAVGFRRPMILLPASLAASLDADDLARVILHESAHLQRYDDWTNAFEQLVCALQFFQPALYVARRGIDFEREVACDDRVLEDSGEPLRYAECLARIVQRHVRGRQAAVVPGFVLRRAQVLARVRRIVDRSRDASPQLRVAAFALGAALCSATLGMARLQVPVVAPAIAEPIVADCLCPPVAHHAAARPVAPAAPPVHAAAPPVHAPAPPAHAPAPAAAAHVAAVAAQNDVPPVATRAPRMFPVTSHLAAARAALESASGMPYPVAPRAPARMLITPDGNDLLAAIDDAKYPHPGVDELVALSTGGVHGASVRGMGALGRNRPSLHQVLVLAEQGVSPEYVATLERRLATPPSLDDVISLRVQGVDGGFVRHLARRGYHNLTLDDLVRLRGSGVEP